MGYTFYILVYLHRFSFSCTFCSLYLLALFCVLCQNALPSSCDSLTAVHSVLTESFVEQCVRVSDVSHVKYGGGVGEIVFF
jgi:hypothetical protein